MMLRSVRMENFRRHERTHIELGDDDRTIVVAGNNGAGKSTIIEAITYGLVGEGRQGGRNLDRLVRRGAELEGMEVELVFDIDNATYRVVRRREGKTASAILCVNDQPLVEGTRHVTAAIEDILGMDSQGVRLAVVAQQKELDMLVRMGGPQRAKALGRLLRLDALSRARDDARQQWRIAQSALEAIPHAADLGELAARVATNKAAHLRAQAAENECRAAVANIDAQLATTGGIDAAYQAGREQLAAATATVAAVRLELSRIEAEQNNIIVPDSLGEIQPMSVLERQATELEHKIAHAEAAQRIGEQRRIVIGEIERAEVHETELRTLLNSGTAAFWQETAAGHRGVAKSARDKAADAAQRREQAREDLGSARSETDSWRRRRAALDELGAVCVNCGQDVPHDHLDAQVREADEKIVECTTAEQAIIKQGVAVRDEWQHHESAAQEAETAAAKADTAALQAASAEGELVETVRRLETLRGQIERLISDEYDIDSLYQRKGEITIAVMNARASSERQKERETAMGRIADLALAIADCRTRLADATGAQTAAQIDTTMEAAFKERQTLLDSHRAELEMLGVLCAQTADARSSEAAAQAELRQANELVGARRAQQTEGVNAANAQRLLGDVEQHLGGQIRPLLEGSVSDILCKMSAGRFTSVRVNPEYDITVLDDGAYRNLSELSGGEADLCALALRLGLSDVICSRNGGVGFLILDEVFGSQDGARRESILTALRALRGTYGQIWCISHVGGLDDAADRVITVELDENGTAHVS